MMIVGMVVLGIAILAGLARAADRWSWRPRSEDIAHDADVARSIRELQARRNPR